MAQIQATTPRQIFPNIDILRGFAAVSVIVYHVIEHFGWSTFPTNGPLVWFRMGWLGVDIFLVISGFVISLSAFNLLDKYDRKSYFLLFTKRRIKRIVPLYLVTSLIFLITVTPNYLFDSSQITNIISHALFLHNLNLNWHGAINGVNWSVALEVQFYILIAFMSPFLRKCHWWYIPLIFIPVAWVWRYSATQIINFDEPLASFRLFWLSTQLPGTLDQFAAGVLIARFVRADGISVVKNIMNFNVVGIFLIVTISMLVITIGIYLSHASFWNYPSMVIFWRTLAALSFAALVVTSCCVVLGPTLHVITAPLRYLGVVSYGLYLWHLIVIESLKRIEWIDGASAIYVVLIMSFILASGSWHLIEKPIMKSNN